MLNDNILIYLLLYVDDILLIIESKSIVHKLKQVLNSKFDMKDLGNAKKILGKVIERDRNTCMLKIQQTTYLHKAVSKFGVLNCKHVPIPFTDQLSKM